MPDTGHLGFVNSVCFDESGRILLSASIEGTVCVWDVERRALVARLPLHDGPINDIAYADGLIATAGFDGRVRLLDADGAAVGHYDIDCPAHAVALSANGVIYGGREGSIYVARNGAVEQLRGHTDAVECLTVADGQVLSGGRDGSIAVWNLSTRRRERSLTGHSAWVTQLAYVKPGQALSVGEDGLAILWDVQKGQALWRVDCGAPIWGLGVVQTPLTAYIGKAGKLMTLDIETRATEEIDGVTGFAVRAVGVSPEGMIALGHDGGGLDVLLPGQKSPVWRIPGQHQGILSAAFDTNGCLIGHQNGTVTFITRRGERVSKTAHRYMAYATASLGDDRIAVGGFDGRITIWQADGQHQIKALDHGGQVFSLVASEDSSRLLSAGNDHWILWDTTNWAIVHREDRIGSGSHTFGSVGPDGALVVTVGEDPVLTVWRDGRFVEKFPLPHRDSSAVALAPDESSVFVAFNDGTVGCVLLDDGEYAELHRIHDSWIRQLIVSRDGNTLLSCSQNGIAVAYDMRLRKPARLGDTPSAAVGFVPEMGIALVGCGGEVTQLSTPPFATKDPVP